LRGRLLPMSTPQPSRELQREAGGRAPARSGHGSTPKAGCFAFGTQGIGGSEAGAVGRGRITAHGHGRAACSELQISRKKARKKEGRKEGRKEGSESESEQSESEGGGPSRGQVPGARRARRQAAAAGGRAGGGGGSGWWRWWCGVAGPPAHSHAKRKTQKQRASKDQGCFLFALRLFSFLIFLFDLLLLLRQLWARPSPPPPRPPARRSGLPHPGSLFRKARTPGGRGGRSRLRPPTPAPPPPARRPG
jgi:hypothetical protein